MELVDENGEVQAEASMVPQGDAHIGLVAEQLGVDMADLQKWLCNRRIVTDTESLVIPLNLKQVSGMIELGESGNEGRVVRRKDWRGYKKRHIPGPLIFCVSICLWLRIAPLKHMDQETSFLFWGCVLSL